jgi:hypothetical protein
MSQFLIHASRPERRAAQRDFSPLSKSADTFYRVEHRHDVDASCADEGQGHEDGYDYDC